MRKSQNYQISTFEIYMLLIKKYRFLYIALAALIVIMVFVGYRYAKNQDMIRANQEQMNNASQSK